MDSAIVTAVIVGGLSVLGTFISAKYTSNVKVAKLEVEVITLKREVREHNGVVTKTVLLEQKIQMLEARIKELQAYLN